MSSSPCRNGADPPAEAGNTHVVASGIVFTVVLVAWPVMMALGQPTGGDDE